MGISSKNLLGAEFVDDDAEHEERMQQAGFKKSLSQGALDVFLDSEGIVPERDEQQQQHQQQKQ